MPRISMPVHSWALWAAWGLTTSSWGNSLFSEDHSYAHWKKHTHLQDLRGGGSGRENPGVSTLPLHQSLPLSGHPASSGYSLEINSAAFHLGTCPQDLTFSLLGHCVTVSSETEEGSLLLFFFVPTILV